MSEFISGYGVKIYCNIQYYSDIRISSLTKLLKELWSRLIFQAALALY